MVSYTRRKRWAGQADKLPTHKLMFLPVLAWAHIHLHSAIDFLPCMRTDSLQAPRNMSDRKIEGERGEQAAVMSLGRVSGDKISC